MFCATAVDWNASSNFNCAVAISFVSYHTRAISMNIVRATAWTLHDAAQKAKGRLCGKRASSPAALG